MQDLHAVEYYKVKSQNARFIIILKLGLRLTA